MLSEVSMPYGDIILTEAEQFMMEGGGNNVTTTAEQLKSGSGVKSPAQTMCEVGPEPHKLTKCRSLDVLTGRDFHSIDDSQNMSGEPEGHEVEMGKSRLQRTSSAGTTVITPSDDSVDVDGSPTRPSVNIWDEGYRKGKRRTRSFL